MPNLVFRRETKQACYFTEKLGDDLGLDMVLVPSGTFLMGSPEDEPERGYDEGPQHETIVPAFYMGRYPVTQAQWRFVAGLPQVKRSLKSTPSHFKGDNHPVETVTWYDAIEFCARLAAYTQRNYRLPSEAEWEYACRAGTTTPFYFGQILTTEVANFYAKSTYNRSPAEESLGQTNWSGHFGIANAFGLCDMHGNVWEWCQDLWHESYRGAPTEGSAWVYEVDEEHSVCVIRGGSWDSDPRSCRSAYRFSRSAYGAENYIGFRVACNTTRDLD